MSGDQHLSSCLLMHCIPVPINSSNSVGILNGREIPVEASVHPGFGRIDLSWSLPLSKKTLPHCSLVEDLFRRLSLHGDFVSRKNNCNNNDDDDDDERQAILYALPLLKLFSHHQPPALLPSTISVLQTVLLVHE